MLNCFCCYVIKSAGETAKEALLSDIWNLLLIEINLSQIKIADIKREEVCAVSQYLLFTSSFGLHDTVTLPSTPNILNGLTSVKITSYYHISFLPMLSLENLQLFLLFTSLTLLLTLYFKLSLPAKYHLIFPSVKLTVHLETGVDCHSVNLESKRGHRPFLLHLVTLWRWPFKVETCQKNSDKNRLIGIMI